MAQSIQWQQANSLGILINEDAAAWHAGRVHDVLSLTGGALLVGTSHGGVWAITSSGDAVPQSDNWNNPDVNCLARGPHGPNHFYAGCDGGGALYESEIDTAFLGSIVWRSVALTDADGNALNTGPVYRIGVLNQIRKIVLACGNGVFWSSIPAHAARYIFKQVPFLQPGAYSGLSIGPNNSVVVGAWGDGSTRFGILYGDWTSGDLLMQRATVTGPISESKLVWTTLASCDANRRRVYAAASDPNGSLITVLRSDDGGQTWRPCSIVTKDAPPGKNLLNSTGNQTFGGWIKTMSVSPSNPDVVAINWARSFISLDGGSQFWIAVGQVPGAADWQATPAYGTHMHEDGHAIVFDVDDPKRLYVATDGGVGATPDLGNSCSSIYNRRMANLMFQSQPARNGYYGTFSASPVTSGLVAGGLQDNGPAYCQLEPNLTPWQTFIQNDGQAMLFLPTGQLIWFDDNNIALRWSTWDGQQFTNTIVIPVDVPKPGVPLPNGLMNAIVELVSVLHFRSRGTEQFMFAVASPLGSNDIYGLFAEDSGTSPHWDYIGSVGIDVTKDAIWALGSIRGDNVYVGTQGGRIFSLSPNSQQSLELSVTLRPTNPGSVLRFLVVHDAVVFAMYNTGAVGLILQSNFFAWDQLGTNSNVVAGSGLPTNEGGFYAIAVDREASPPSLFAATDNHVYISRDEGDTWQLATSGLPVRPHCADLRVVTQPTGERFIYLSTFGRSLWRARLDGP